MHIEHFKNIHLALYPRVLRFWWQTIKAEDLIFSKNFIERFYETISNFTQKDSVIPIKEYKKILITKKGYCIALNDCPKKETIITWDLNLQKELLIPPYKLEYLTNINENIIKKYQFIELFDRDFLLKDKLKVRFYCNGDTIIPFSHKKEKKVKKIFNDCSFPKILRRKIPFIIQRNKILWVPMIKRSHLGLITDKSHKTALAFSYSKNSNIAQFVRTRN